jgi:hypothetical protein
MTCGLAFTACTVEDNPNPLPLGEPDPDEWEIDFVAMANKYAEWTATTISAEVYEGMGTCSIVDGTLAEPLEDGTTTFSEEYDQRFALQTGTNWRLHYDAGKELKGLYSQNGGGRNFGVLNAKKDQIITLVMTAQPTVNLGNVDLYSKTDSSYVYYVNEDCNVRFNVARYNYIKYVSVKKFYGAEYTVKFVNEKGEKVKDDVKHMGYINKPVSLMPGDIEPINLDGGGRLIFKEADNTEENVVKKDGSTVITVVYREAEKQYVVLQCMAGTTLLYRFNDTEKYWFYEGASLTLYPSRCYGKDGVYYTTPATTWNGTQFTFPGNLTPTVNSGKTYYIGTQSYEKDESIVYFANFEDLALPKEDVGNGTGLGQLIGTVNNWWNFTNGYWERFDGGRGIRLDADSYVWTEPITVAGTYNVVIYGRNDVSQEVDNPYILGIKKTGEDNVKWLTNGEVTIKPWGSATTGENVVENVAIEAGDCLVIKNDDAAKMISLDDIKVVKPTVTE